MQLDERLDWWSIDAKLEEIIDHGSSLEYDTAQEKKSEYYGAYEELFCEMSNCAADLYNRMHRIKHDLDCKMPNKKVSFYDDDDQNSGGVAWFNTCMSLLDDTDMAMLLLNEKMDDCYDINDFFCETEKNKRFKAMQTLTKKDMMRLFCIASNFAFDYLKLKNAYETIRAIIAELEIHNSFLMKRGETIIPEAAWLL